VQYFKKELLLFRRKQDMKTSFFIIIFILGCYFPVAGQAQDSATFKSLLPYDFHLAYLKEDKAVLIDVREFFEFRSRRIKDAVNIPSSGNLDFAADTINKESALFLYCTTGYRSEKAAEYFCKNGFGKVFSLEGGIAAWKRDGFPVEKKRVKRHR